MSDQIPTASKSRINTAICALFAASATKLKSRRKGDVVSTGLCTGAGCCACWVCGADVGPDKDDCVAVDDEEKYEGWLDFEGPWREGEERGASILRFGDGLVWKRVARLG